MHFMDADMMKSLTTAAQVYITKTKFDTTVELYKLGLMSTEDFLETIKKYTNGIPFDVDYVKKKTIEELNNQRRYLDQRYKTDLMINSIKGGK